MFDRTFDIEVTVDRPEPVTFTCTTVDGTEASLYDPTLWLVSRPVQGSVDFVHVDRVFSGAPGCTEHGRQHDRETWCEHARAAFGARTEWQRTYDSAAV